MEESVRWGLINLIHPTAHIIFKPFTFSTGITILVMLFLLLCTALISGSETAFFSLSVKEKEELRNTKSRSNNLIIRLLSKPNKLLATILISNNFLNIAIIILSTYLVNMLVNFGIHTTVRFITQTIIVTFMILLLGEVIPKVYATYNSRRMAQLMAFPLLYLSKILSPLSAFLIRSTKVVNKRVKKKSHNISVDELSQALELTSDKTDDDEEQKILKGIVRFGDISVKQVMKPRLDVEAIEIGFSFDEVLKIILDSGYSRLPVYKENFDNIKGVLYIKDVLPYVEKEKNYNWQHLIRQAFFVPENKKLDDLLKDFQSKKIHLAIVVDEYGGTKGIISLEDVLEEIVGDISDEFDEDDLVYSKLDENNYVFEGKTQLNDVFRVVNIEGQEFEEAKGDADTLAGFVIEIAGRIPQKNEKFNFGPYLFTVEAADKRRVKRVKMTMQKIMS